MRQDVTNIAKEIFSNLLQFFALIDKRESYLYTFEARLPYIGCQKNKYA